MRKKLVERYKSSIFTIVLSFIIGILIISFIIWARLIRERLPVEVSGEIYSLRFWVSTYLFLFFLLFTIVYSIKVYKKLRGIDQDGYITRLRKNFFSKHEKLTKWVVYIIMHILESPMFVWILLYDSSPGAFKRFVHRLCFWLGGFILDYVDHGRNYIIDLKLIKNKITQAEAKPKFEIELTPDTDQISSILKKSPN